MEDLDRLARFGSEALVGDRWCLCANGRQLRLVDATRVYTDCHLEFDLEVVSLDARSFALLWAVLHARAFERSSDRSHTPLPALIDRFAAMSVSHATSVCGSLQRGVLEAVGEVLTSLLTPKRRDRRARPPSQATLSAAFEGSLTAVYRVLFLLFAEARGLVPIWHPVYRDSYTIEALRTAVERVSKLAPVGSAPSHLQARARRLRRRRPGVTPFNGRLFAPMPIIDASRAREESVQRALLVLSTTEGPHTGRQRIDYRDLGVEQLGAVYEGVLDYEPAWTGDSNPAVRLQRTGRERKATGTFYTPRSLTEYLVRRTLHPLTRDATPEAILSLRILDPAMGSGAFLVAACHYLSRAYEAALVSPLVTTESPMRNRDTSEGGCSRCLFGAIANHGVQTRSRLAGTWPPNGATFSTITWRRRQRHRSHTGGRCTPSPTTICRYPIACGIVVAPVFR